MKVGKLLGKIPGNCIVRVECAGEFVSCEYPIVMMKILQERGDVERKVKMVFPLGRERLLIVVK